MGLAIKLIKLSKFFKNNNFIINLILIKDNINEDDEF